MAELRKYGAATTILFPLIDAGAQDFENTPVTFAAGDVQISKDEGAFANTTNLPAHEGNGIYSLAVTGVEMQGARIVVTVIDQTATKEWEDQAILIETYGDASAEHALDLDSATVDVGAINGSVEAAQDLQKSAATILPGTVDTTGFTPTQSEFEADDITEGTSDHYKGRIVIFTSGALKDQASDITAYSLQTGRGHFTVSPLTEAPANTDTFVIV